MLYITNERLKGKRGGAIKKYESLEKIAKNVIAKIHIKIDAGEFEKLTLEELKPIRAKAGLKGGKASGVVRQTQTQTRREEVQKLLDAGITNPIIIADRLNVDKRTVYRDLKALR